MYVIMNIYAYCTCLTGNNNTSNHGILTGRLCCTGIQESRWFIQPREQTLDGGTVIFKKRNEQVYVNRIPVTTCDSSATNGVVHSLNEFLPESIRKYVPRRHSSARPTGRRNWWEVMSSYFDDEDEDDLFDVVAGQV